MAFFCACEDEVLTELRGTRYEVPLAFTQMFGIDTNDAVLTGSDFFHDIDSGFTFSSKIFGCIGE